jgi:ankyrin repeat protein
LPVVELLLSISSVRVNAATSAGWTALYAAALNGHDAIVDALLAKALSLSLARSLARSFVRALYLFLSLSL